MGAWLLAAMTGFAGAAGVTKYQEIHNENIASADVSAPSKTTHVFVPPLPVEKPIMPALSALKLAAEKTPLPFKFMKRLAEAESTMNPKAKAKTSSACGLTQLTPDVIYPYLFKHGARHGFQEAALIERTRFKSEDGVITLKYGLHDENDKAIIDSSCQKPDFSAIIGAEYMWDIVVYLQNDLHKDRLPADEAYAGFVFGKIGSAPLIEAFNNPREQHHPAKDLVSARTVKANLRFFFKDPENRRYPRSVAELNDILEGKMGTEELPHIKPRSDYSFQVASTQP